MMGRREQGQSQFFYAFELDKPADHLVRQIDAVLDLSWVHKELDPYYSNTGRPSIDPVLMIRMLIIGYICVSAWNKDPLFGVIGIQSGPRHSGSTLASIFHGSRDWNAGRGDDCEDPSRVFRSRSGDQGDMSRPRRFAEGRTEGHPFGGD